MVKLNEFLEGTQPQSARRTVAATVHTVSCNGGIKIITILPHDTQIAFTIIEGPTDMYIVGRNYLLSEIVESLSSGCTESTDVVHIDAITEFHDDYGVYITAFKYGDYACYTYVDGMSLPLVYHRECTRGASVDEAYNRARQIHLS